MGERVIPYAESIGAEYYAPPKAPQNQWLENNRAWLNIKMDQRYQIIDIGEGPVSLKLSIYYNMELQEISKRNYSDYHKVNPGF